MQIGVIGLGRMGGNITRRLIENGHEAVVYDRDAKAVAALGRDGAVGAEGLDTFVRQLLTEDTIVELAKLLARDDIIIDGGNTFWKDDVRRAKTLAHGGKDAAAGADIDVVHSALLTIIDDGLMAIFHQAARDVATHASETDHADLHVTAPIRRARVRMPHAVLLAPPRARP